MPGVDATLVKLGASELGERTLNSSTLTLDAKPLRKSAAFLRVARRLCVSVNDHNRYTDSCKTKTYKIAWQYSTGLVLFTWAREGNGLDQTLPKTEIEQLDVRIHAEL